MSYYEVGLRNKISTTDATLLENYSERYMRALLT